MIEKTRLKELIDFAGGIETLKAEPEKYTDEELKFAVRYFYGYAFAKVDEIGDEFIRIVRNIQKPTLIIKEREKPIDEKCEQESKSYEEILQSEDWDVLNPSPTRLLIDNLIFDILELTQGERDGVYEETISLIESRLKKSQSV